MFKEKPVISNQYGALAMALLPFLYAFIDAKQWRYELMLFGVAWLFLYLFSYPFFQLFSKKVTLRNKRWAIIYFAFSLAFALPALVTQPYLLFFILPLFPLGIIQYFYAKKRDERHLINDIAGILVFGVVGMATYYLATSSLDFRFLLHPTLFFIATTFYVKSMVRERRNPLYMELNIGCHFLLSLIYLLWQEKAIFIAYLFALTRAIVVPSLQWNVKKLGMFEFLTLVIFFSALIY